MHSASRTQIIDEHASGYKIAIGESGLTGVPESSGQIPCTGNCINASAVSPYGATGIWQVKCPESRSVLIYNAFESNGLIDGTGQCVDLKVPANNALAASLYIYGFVSLL